MVDARRLRAYLAGVAVVNGLSPSDSVDVTAVREFLVRVGLTFSGLGSPSVHLWLLQDATGSVRGCTGYEASRNGMDVLIRSVAVDEQLRGRGVGSTLAQFVLDEAVRRGARRAWLFSRRAGPFWQRLGFQRTDLASLTRAMADTHQVEYFRESGELHRKVAWGRSLTG